MQENPQLENNSPSSDRHENPQTQDAKPKRSDSDSPKITGSIPKIRMKIEGQVRVEVTVRNEARRSTIGSPIDSEAPQSTRTLVKDLGESSTNQDIPIKTKKVGIPGTIFTLLTGVLGAGIITLPYVIYVNGLILGPMLIIGSALITQYASTLLVQVAQQLGKQNFNEMARDTYGDTFAKIVNIAIIVEHLGVVVAYMVLLKSLLPQTLISLIGKQSLPLLLQSQVFWATFSAFVIFMMGLQKTIKCLSYSSPLSFFSIMFLMFLIFIEYIIIGQNKTQNLQDATLFHFSFQGVMGTYPLVLFAYLYQPNVPAAHHELLNSTHTRMNKVFIGITVISGLIYIVFGIFGYLTFAHMPQELEKINILEATPYSQRYECQYAFLFYCIVVFMACPLVLKPIKDSISNRLWRGRFTLKQNVLVTMLIVGFCYTLSLLIPIISDVIHVLGSTTSPFVCFIMPISLYLKINKKCSCNTVCAYLVIVFMFCFSVISLAVFILEKTGHSI